MDPDKPLEGVRLAVLQVALHWGKKEQGLEMRAQLGPFLFFLNIATFQMHQWNLHNILCFHCLLLTFYILFYLFNLYFTRQEKKKKSI